MGITPHEPQSGKWPDVARHYLSDLVYGANDGIITTFAVVSGVTGADLAGSIVIILGFANLLADGVSMGASNFLAIRSGARAAGQERGVKEPMAHAAATFASFVLAGMIPLLAYLIPGAIHMPFLTSCIATGLALFGVGALRALVVEVFWLKGGLEMLSIGAVAAAIAYGVGLALAPLLK